MEGGKVSARPLLLQQCRGAPVAAVIEPVQDLEIGGKQGVAPSKRSDRGFLRIVRSDPHGDQNNPVWLTSRCERGPRGPQLRRQNTDESGVDPGPAGFDWQA